MKIYSELLIDIRTGVVEKEVAVEYSGLIAECKGGSGEVKETSQERALANISKEQWNQYQTRLAPFENEWISNIKMDSGDQAIIAGQVGTNVGSEYDKAQGEVAANSFQSGLDPSSGRFKAAAAGLSDSRAVADSRGKQVASQAVDDQTYQGLQSAIAMGRGQAAEATRDMTSLAYDATGKAISDARNKQDNRQTWVSSASSAAGMGLAGWNNRKKDGLLPVSELQANGEE